jgi:hypothetical protein
VRIGLAALLVLSSGCATMARLTNLPDPECRGRFREGLHGILRQQGETEEAAATLAGRTCDAFEADNPGPRPFLIAAPSGTDYAFFVEEKRGRCLLRLYGRRHGFVSYTNNLTYIATRSLDGCRCAG